MEPVFLTFEEVVEIHANHIEVHGGHSGIRDPALLQSALAAPQAAFGGQYLHGDLCEMAAAYVFHIARNHPFADGNKRTALLSAFVFLNVNGLRLTAGESDFEDAVRAAAEGRTDKAAIAEFFRAHTEATSD